MKYLYLILQMNWYETLFIFIKIWAMFNCKNFLCNSFHFHLSFVDACKVKTIINSVLKLFCYCKNVSLYWFIFCTSLAYLCCIWLLPIMKKERRKHQLLFFFFQKIVSFHGKLCVVAANGKMTTLFQKYGTT